MTANQPAKYERLGEALRAAREHADLTQSNVASRLEERGLVGSQPTITRWERGTHAPQPEVLEALAEWYGCDVAEFVLLAAIGHHTGDQGQTLQTLFDFWSLLNSGVQGFDGLGAEQLAALRHLLARGSTFLNAKGLCTWIDRNSGIDHLWLVEGNRLPIHPYTLATTLYRKLQDDRRFLALYLGEAKPGSRYQHTLHELKSRAGKDDVTITERFRFLELRERPDEHLNSSFVLVNPLRIGDSVFFIEHLFREKATDEFPDRINLWQRLRFPTCKRLYGRVAAIVSQHQATPPQFRSEVAKLLRDHLENVSFGWTRDDLG